jgi:hypothetical protein
MKKLLFLVSLGVVISCSTSKKAPVLYEEDQLLITRLYLGNFVDYRYTGPEDTGGPHLIWIKTTMDSTYGKISAYGKKCDFSAGDKIFLKRTSYTLGVSEYWDYQVENDSSVYYKTSDFQYDKKVLVQSWFDQ